MAAKKNSPRKAAPKKQKFFEETLWDTANPGEVPADTFFNDQHPDLKADTAQCDSGLTLTRSQTAGRPRSGRQHMANPPFNLKDWRGPATSMRGSANRKPEGRPQATSEARNQLVHDGRWNRFTEGVTPVASLDRLVLFSSANLASAN